MKRSYAVFAAIFAMSILIETVACVSDKECFSAKVRNVDKQIDKMKEAQKQSVPKSKYWGSLT